MTKQELIALLVDGHLLTGSDCENLINSLKGVQAAVETPEAEGFSIEFVCKVTQDSEGVITVERRKVNFSGYLPDTGDWQKHDIQVVDEWATDGTFGNLATTIVHNKEHYPTVRLIDSNDMEVRPTASVPDPFEVMHVSENEVKITLAGPLNNGSTYRYVLD